MSALTLGMLHLSHPNEQTTSSTVDLKEVEHTILNLNNPDLESKQSAQVYSLISSQVTGKKAPEIAPFFNAFQRAGPRPENSFLYLLGHIGLASIRASSAP